MGLQLNLCGNPSTPPSTTVNGVTFAPFAIPFNFPALSTVTVGNVTPTESLGLLFAYNTFGSATAPFSGLNSNYQSLLGAGAYADAPNTITVSQWPDIWAGLSAAVVDEQVGQFAISTFTASGTTQALLLSATSGFSPLINAWQVRAVPEPTTSALAAVATAAGWLAWRRRGR